MNSSRKKFKLLAVAAALGMGVAGTAQATLDLTGLQYVTYGDGNSYALQVDGTILGSTGPGSPLYVNSTPGAIQDLIVVATGSSGGPVTTNFSGMDPALATPSGVSGSNYFSGLWNSTLTDFIAHAGTSPIFLFNNNQTKSGGSLDENVAVWAQVSLTGLGQTTLYFDFTNNGGAYALITAGGGGVLNGSVGAYQNLTGAGPLAGTNLATDYVLSGGKICLLGSTPVPCGTPGATSPIDNNLGANQAAYAIDAPELDAFLAAWIGGGFAGYTDIHVDLRYGCDPATIGTSGGTAGVGDCVGRDANNGYEQLFIATSETVINVPEPGMLGLLALGFLGLGATYRRKI